MKIKKWETLKSEPLYESGYVSLFKDTLKKPDGSTTDWHRAVKKDWAMVVALTETKKVPLVYQYRHGVGEAMWTLPAGQLDEKQTAQEAAERELKEETGFTAKNYLLLGEFVPSSAFSEERGFLFLCEQAQKTHDQILDPDEDIEVELFDFDKLLSDIKERKSFLIDSNSVLALLLAEKELYK